MLSIRQRSFSTDEEDGLPADFIRQRAEQHIPHEHADEKQRPRQAHFVRLLLDQVPLQTKHNTKLVT